MSNRRQIQHREKRDTNTKEVGELRREIERLTRQIARLRRENDRLQGLTTEKEDSPAPSASKLPNKPTCPKCGSTNLGQLNVPGGKKVTACRACKDWKTRPI